MVQIKPNFFRLSAIAFLLMLLVSCNKNVVFSDYTKLPEEGWKTDNRLKFEVDIKDNNALHNVFLNVRHADSYPYANLFVFLTTTYPDGKTSVDTLECIFADKKGKWVGDGAGDLWDNKIPLKKNLRFPQTGKYTFSFEQGMRSNPLPLILDFGMTIEKAQ
ncbi:MAG: motility protein [Bacteroidetes bacterium]|jgi:gliding motility-associated lipoprotein GldH|nr:motility protein [Bacteroidota bacterium]